MLQPYIHHVVIAYAAYAGHSKVAPVDPLEVYCNDNPDADECR